MTPNEIKYALKFHCNAAQYKRAVGDDPDAVQRYDHHGNPVDPETTRAAFVAVTS